MPCSSRASPSAACGLFATLRDMGRTVPHPRGAPPGAPTALGLTPSAASWPCSVSCGASTTDNPVKLRPSAAKSHTLSRRAGDCRNRCGARKPMGVVSISSCQGPKLSGGQLGLEATLGMLDFGRGVLKPACTGKRLLASIGRMSPAAAGLRCDDDCLAGQQLDTPRGQNAGRPTQMCYSDGEPVDVQ